MSRQHGSSTSGQRQLRVGEEIRHALAWILERGEVRDPRLAGAVVTVTEVRVSPDLRQATAFIVPLGGQHESEVVAALEHARGFLRRRVAEAVQLRNVPQLTFRLDRSFDEADRMNRVLRDPRVARDLGAHEHEDENDDDDNESDSGAERSGGERKGEPGD